MKTNNGTPWPSLDKVPPSIVFQTVAFLQVEDGEAVRREQVRLMVEAVETAAKLSVREFFEPTRPPRNSSADEVQRTVAAMAAFISIVEHGGLEQSVRMVNAPDLLLRLLSARDQALRNVRASRAILVAALENAFGVARNETAEDRLRRAIEMAKSEAPLYLGSFSQFADEPDEQE